MKDRDRAFQGLGPTEIVNASFFSVLPISIGLGTSFASIKNAAKRSASAWRFSPTNIVTPRKSTRIITALLFIGLLAAANESAISLAKSSDSCPPEAATESPTGPLSCAATAASRAFCSDVSRRGWRLIFNFNRSASASAARACCLEASISSFLVRSLASPASFLVNSICSVERKSCAWLRSSDVLFRAAFALLTPIEVTTKPSAANPAKPIKDRLSFSQIPARLFRAFLSNVSRSISWLRWLFSSTFSPIELGLFCVLTIGQVAAIAMIVRRIVCT
jgi:hypothetical protein